MHAAVVTSYDSAPIYAEMPTPEPTRESELLVDVIAAGLHPRVRSQATGAHYTSTDELPLVPGIDGVGRGPDGVLRYFILPDTTMGSMAERTVIDRRRSIVLPEGCDPLKLAASMNPAMSSWIALRQRIRFQPGQNILVLGATGNAGRLAVQVAEHLGAGRIVGAGRDSERLAELPALGATDTVMLDDPELGELCSDTDVVLDYLWGEPTTAAMTGIVTRRADRAKQLTWLEIGSIAGASAAIPSAALRAARLEIVGSGQGSVATEQILAELPELARELGGGGFDIDVSPIPLSDIEDAWSLAVHTRRRIVIVP